MNVTIVFIVLYNVLCSLESLSEGYVLNDEDLVIIPRTKTPDAGEGKLKSSAYIGIRDSETTNGTHLNGNSMRTRRSSNNQENMYYLPKPLSHNHQIVIKGKKTENNSIGVTFSNGTDDKEIFLDIPETNVTLRFVVVSLEIDEHRIHVFHQDSHQKHVAVENISDFKYFNVTNIDVESLTFKFKDEN